MTLDIVRATCLSIPLRMKLLREEVLIRFSLIDLSIPLRMKQGKEYGFRPNFTTFNSFEDETRGKVNPIGSPYTTFNSFEDETCCSGFSILRGSSTLSIPLRMKLGCIKQYECLGEHLSIPLRMKPN